MIRISRKERERRQRRESIVDAAEEIILELGFDAATMDEIAEQSEVSKGTLYLYFENKTALYLAICERGSQKLNDRFGEVLTMDRSGLEMIRALGEVYLTFVREMPLYFQAFSHYEAIQDEEFLKENPIAKQCEEHAKQSLTYIVRCLQVGMQDGSIDDSYDPKELALLVWSCSRGVVQMTQLCNRKHHYALIDDMDVDLDALIPLLLKVLEKGMKGE